MARYHKTRDIGHDFYCSNLRYVYPLRRPLCCPITYNRTMYTPYYATDALVDVEVTVPPGFSPVQVATELGSSASNVCGRYVVMISA